MSIMAQPTMRSPVSPYDRRSKSSFSAPQQQHQRQPRRQQQQCFTASPIQEHMSPQNGSNRGLGLYPMPVSESTVTDMSVSANRAGDWSQPQMMGQDYSQSQPPDIFSAAFDPFSGFPSSNNTGMVGAQSPEAPGLEYCQTSPSSNLSSHRGSVSSSYGASDAYSQSGSDCAYTPRVKVEGNEQWYQSGSEHVLQRALSSNGPLTYSASSNTLASQTEDLYRTQSAEWSKNDTTGYITELHASPDGRLPQFDVQPILPSVTRIKKKRQRTTPEEATHECRVCGKLFKRSYNWKSHLETHNPERKYPHPCTAMVGNNACAKKFQRKTDLDRHYDSVHLKARNHKCNLCGHRFARRDTLRRHTEDGCPKRFELGIRDASAVPTSAARWSFSTFPPRARSYSVGMPQASPMAPPGSATSNATFPLYSRASFEQNGHLSSPAYAS